MPIGPLRPADIARHCRAGPPQPRLPPQCSARGLRLAADSVYQLAHWTADRDLPKRFAVPFLVARMPPGQEPVADETEQFEPVWVRPADALARHEAGQFFMIFPTIRTLQRLAQFANTQAVLAALAHEQPLWTSCPRSGLLAGKEARYMEARAALRRAGPGLPRWPDRPPAGLAERARACRCSRTCSA